MDAATIRGLTPRLFDYLAGFEDCFARRDTREHLGVYVQGQLSDLTQKSVEPMALKAGVPPRTLQEFLAAYRWDEDGLRTRVHTILAREHACPRSIGIIDETSDTKKGLKTPGVQRQHCGAVGKQDNCIVTVHLGYAADDFHCLVDGELFLPESWSNDRERCREAGIPDTMVYRTKTDIALELYDRAVGHGLHFEWLTFDEWYGVKPQFLRALDQREQKFVGEVHKGFTAWAALPKVTNRPFRRGGRGRSRRTPRITAGSARPLTVADMMRFHRPLREQAWQRYRIKDGEKGPQIWEVKHQVIYLKNEDDLPGAPYHLIVARNVLEPDVIKYFVSNAPPETSVSTMLLVAFSRWRVERCFEDEKGELGLDHYEGRRYLGLKRHLIITSVSHLFLAKVHQELRGEKSRADRMPSAHGGVGSGAEPMAFWTSGSTRAGANRRRIKVHPITSRAGTQKPHQGHSEKTSRHRYPPHRGAAVHMGLKRPCAVVLVSIC